MDTHDAPLNPEGPRNQANGSVATKVNRHPYKTRIQLNPIGSWLKRSYTTLAVTERFVDYLPTENDDFLEGSILECALDLQGETVHFLAKFTNPTGEIQSKKRALEIIQIDLTNLRILNHFVQSQNILFLEPLS